jgi:hypothetical protein
MGTTTEAAARRKFGLLDAMILVVAAALSLFWLRERSRMVFELISFDAGHSPRYSTLMTARGGLELVVPILAPLTCASIVLRSRPPRPSRRRVLCQPGLVACLAASMVFVFHLAKRIAAMAAWGLVSLSNPSSGNYFFGPSPYDDNELGEAAAFAGVAVLGAWLTLAVGRRWRPEASWVDRLGRLLGLAWIATIPFEIAFKALWPLGLTGQL